MLSRSWSDGTTPAAIAVDPSWPLIGPLKTTNSPLAFFAFWHPGKALWGAYLFGAAIAFQLQAQVMGLKIPSYILEMFPYLLTIVVLTVVTVRNRRAGQTFMPAALGLPFFRGDKH